MAKSIEQALAAIYGALADGAVPKSKSIEGILEEIAGKITAGGSAGSVSKLSDLSDVSVGEASTGQVLQYNGTNWEAKDPIKKLGDLADVDTAEASEGRVLKYTTDTWKPGTDETSPAE